MNWPPSVSEVLLDVGANRGEPRYQRLARVLRTAIHSGRLQPGETLPASRVVAADLGWSRWVVTEAYQQLAAEGYLEARRGSGTRVARAPAVIGPAAAGPSAPAGRGPVSRLRIDLRPGRPDLSAFPRRDWLRAYAATTRSVSVADLGYPDPRGLPRLRDTVARYLRRVRGIDVPSDAVIITHGTTAAMGIVARALAANGERVLSVEDPGWQRLPEVARGYGIDVVPVPVDDEGLMVDRLRPAGHAVLATPAHQFPLGATMSAERRLALLAWAVTHDGLVIEDDYDAEFRYDRRPVGALAGVDRGRIAYLGSISKTLAPALRLGWLIPPPHLHEDILENLDAGAGPSSLEQLTFAQLVESGGYDRHLRRMRRLYRTRRDALVTALRQAVPSLPVTGVAAGLHLVLPLDDADEERSVVTALARAGFLTTRLGRYTRTSAQAGLVLGYAQLPTTTAPAVADAIAHARAGNVKATAESGFG